MSDDDLQSKLKSIGDELESIRKGPQADLSGDGAVAQGSGAKAVGREGILIEGNVYLGSDSKIALLESDAPALGEAPFKGLQHFDVEDAHLFFGRTGLTNILLEHIRTQRFLAVVGASGSGKSSLVRAGVVAALKSQPGWHIHIMTPTAQPLETLALVMTRASESVSAAKTLREDMRSDPESLHLYARRLMADDSKVRMLLVVDQFEELFTLCRDSVEREAFINNLLTAVSEERQGPLTVMFTLRADFYHHCMQYRPLLIALPKYQINVGIMTPRELREAITVPAEKGGWEFEPRLVDLMLQDVGDEPGTLPLLSHALLETWSRRRGRTLTLAGYLEAGGVRGAIARTAENTFRDLTDDQKQIARNIFLRLTDLGEGTQDTRRRVRMDELEQGSDKRDSVGTVLQALADARLVTTDKDSVEVAHEALIREWPTLRLWLDEDREALQIHHHLTATAREWERNQWDPSDLYRGTRLAQALEWSKLHASEMSPLESKYLQASQVAQARERQRVQFPLAILVVIVVVYVGWLLSSGILNIFIYRPLAMEWVTIPAGEFRMGNETGRSNERPVHVVDLKTYAIGKYEVTNEQYYQCVKAGVCLPPRNERYTLPESLNYPVTDVSWYDAKKFCAWNDRNGRLPTEAEWEKAARGTDERIYPWGDELDCNHANYYDGTAYCAGDTKAIGSYDKGKSPYGVYDMIGNVHEWVADQYLPYPGNLESDPKYGETYRVLRGGSWGYNFLQTPTSTLRVWNNPWDSNIGIFGFRCARAVSQ